MLEIKFYRNDLIKSDPVRSAAKVNDHLALLTHDRDLTIYAAQSSGKPTLSKVFTKSFKKMGYGLMKKYSKIPNILDFCPHLPWI